VPLFGRKDKGRAARGADEPQRIAAFWDWWASEGADGCARAIADREPQRVVDDLSTRIGAVQAGLAWELAPGGTSEHQLVVSPEGSAELRAVARRWLRAAPPPSAAWEYADSRQASADLDDVVLNVGGVDLPLGELAAQVEPDRYRLDVTLQHAVLDGLPERDRLQIAFLALDNALGEEAVEMWIGAIDVATTPLADGVPLARLRDRLDAHRAEHLDEQGAPSWRILQGSGPDGPLLVSAMVPLHPTVAPHHDDHLAVAVPYSGRNDQGFPDGPALDALRALEDHLTERLGGSGMLVAHETSSGLRTLHYYVDSTTPAADVLRTAVTGWNDGTVRVTSEHDPGWQAVRQFG